MYYALKKTRLKEVYIVRYADDFKIFCRHHNHAKRIFAAVQKWLLERLSLEISPEKSKITNLRKGYSEFLGIKMKVRPKGKMIGKDSKKDRFVATSHLADKARSKILHEVRRHTKLMQKPVANEGHVFVNDYNAYVMGIHGYYCCATLCSKDFSEIAFRSRSALKNRLTPRRRKPKEPLPAYIQANSLRLRQTVIAHKLCSTCQMLPVQRAKHLCQRRQTVRTRETESGISGNSAPPPDPSGTGT